MRINNLHCEVGQALVTLLAFVATAIIITTGAIFVTVINSQTTGKYVQGEEALSVAQAGGENALERLLRDPSYTGETFVLGNGSANVTVSGSTTKTIISEGIHSDFRRKIQIIVSFTSNIFTVTSWKEID